MSLLQIIHGIFTIEQWNIGYIDQSVEELMQAQETGRVHWLLSPAFDECYADPFPIQKDGIFIFFERYNYSSRKGNISFITWPARPGRDTPELALEKSHHLSFPYVFEHAGTMYMVPEEWTTNRITLYQSVRFPSEWQAVSVLLDNVMAVDVTVFPYHNFWWLMFAPRDKALTSLSVYYSPDLMGPWFAHKRNPVKNEICGARPAGRPFLFRGNLIRPAQDCSRTYGGGVILNQIVRLSPEEFEEKPVKAIYPNKEDRFNKGIHTFNSFDRIVIVDGKRRMFSLLNLRHKLRRAGKRIMNSA